MGKAENFDSTRHYRPRRSFAKIPDVMDVPNLIAIQTESFKQFVDQGLATALRHLTDRIQQQGYVR